MAPYILRSNPTPEDSDWSFILPSNVLSPPTKRRGLFGKFIKFTADQISLSFEQFPSNRILHDDDSSKFILMSFSDLRFPDSFLSVTADYIERFTKAGVFLNGVSYRFYHHSNSQLRSRSCFFREAKTDAELDQRIYALGDFGRIMNVAKRAKRIGLLFSEASIDYRLDPRWTADIPDLASGDEVFSDGCGLISRRLAVQLSKSKRIIFHGSRYTPCVFQIRYLGYKGVLMLHPDLDREQKHLVEFRKSMKKFSATQNYTFSIVDYSQPYAFGRLNNDIIVLLSSLGITNEVLLAKQQAYFDWIAGASRDHMLAADFLSCLGEHELAERVLLDGLDHPEVLKAVQSKQRSEVANFKKNDRPRARMLIRNSRLVFGVCDPYKGLKEGQVHIRMTNARTGPTTLIQGDVLVVRNPCLHPGDCLKLRAVDHPNLSHLHDCIVFAAVAKPGHHSAPSMSSGGDLDGDRYFVCWDKDLVPSRVSESYDYPPNKEHVSKQVTRVDLARHFAMYNNASLARVAKLHAKWVRSTTEGALSSQCQELNALHSQSVDGAKIKIPDRLLTPPESEEPYIIDLLAKAAASFADTLTILLTSTTSNARNGAQDTRSAETEEAEKTVVQILTNHNATLSEFEVFNLALKICRRHNIDIRPHLPHVTFSALSAQEKYAVVATLGLNSEEHPYIWNSLLRSDIITMNDLKERQLDHPWSMQRLYSSKATGLSSFFSYLKRATQDYTRKLLILQTDERFAVGVFIRGDIPWDDDPEVDENVVVCSFMRNAPEMMSTYQVCSKGYRLHCGNGSLQLYEKNRGNTFIFITRPAAASGNEIATSIALQKISGRVQKQIGRLNRTPVTAIELHVVSNRDRTAHQLFDLWFEHVSTEEYIGRLGRQRVPYDLNTVQGIDWNTYPQWVKAIFAVRKPADRVSALQGHLADKTSADLFLVMQLCRDHHAEDELFWTFDVVSEQQPLLYSDILHWIQEQPALVFTLLKRYPPDEAGNLTQDLTRLRKPILASLIRSANQTRVAALVGLEKLAATIRSLHLEDYLELLNVAACSIRFKDLAREVLLVLHDSRVAEGEDSDALRYAHKHALAVAADRADEASDECPCNESGYPGRQRHAPTAVNLFETEEKHVIKAHVRVDARTNVRLHSHIRLQAASKPLIGWTETPIMDGIVRQATRGELRIGLLHPPPPEMAKMQWNMYDAGGTATSNAMMDAILRLSDSSRDSCVFRELIMGKHMPAEISQALSSDASSLDGSADVKIDLSHLNTSQTAAVKSCAKPLSLIWGPPGTGKTTVVISVLHNLLQGASAEHKILMTASTHNAVDNVLERFIILNRQEQLLPEEHILRVATDHSKVSKALQSYTIDARLGGDMNSDNRLAKKAQERVKAAVLIFATCAGSGLGLLRKQTFQRAIIDEASQITEPCALIPLVKGCQSAVLVGDHVQLRPSVGSMAKALEHDISLLERLYSGPNRADIAKTMLNVQYRFPRELAAFPSAEFYHDNLRSGIQDSSRVLRVLERTSFPWPRHHASSVIVPTVFVQCDTEEDLGGASKSNAGQVELVSKILPMLRPVPDEIGGEAPLAVTVLSPYTKQLREIKALNDAPNAFTVDSFQGRESDVIVFTSVRCNAAGEVGFLEDSRRLNVMWTRAKLALIIIGDRRTLSTTPIWARAIGACTEVKLGQNVETA